MGRRKRRRAPVPKVFIASNERYDLPFYAYGELDFDYEVFYKNPRRYRLVVLTGGEDISPSIYGHKTSKFCGAVNVQRDKQDLFVAWLAIHNSIPIVGICRGAQLLNCMSGGTLIQHCKGHDVWHDIRTLDDRLIRVSSTHHQMMLPPEHAEILAWADPTRSKEFFGGPSGKIKAPEKEVDVLYLPNINALATQYHPEYMSDTSEAFMYSQELVESKLGVSPVKPNWQDYFVSLPKPEITNESIKTETDYVRSLSDEEKKKHFEAKWEEDYIAFRVRDYMGLLYSEDEAKKYAIVEVEELKAEWAEAEARLEASKQSKKEGN